MQKKYGLIILDPGHGADGNPFGDSYFEGTQNYLLAQALTPILQEAGYTVETTRPALSDDPTLEARGHMAGEKKARLFLSLHSDAPGSNLSLQDYVKVRGVTVYYSLADEPVNAQLAEKLALAASSAMATTNRGIRTRTYPDRPGIDYYGVLRASAESGCKRAALLECGFHTNPEDAKAITEPAAIAKLADAIAAAIFAADEEGIL